MERTYYVYIVASWNRTLYIGMTNDVVRRAWEHRAGKLPGFTARYKCNRLVHFEVYGDPASAIGREKELKGWRRDRKIALIETSNPSWRDLYPEIGGENS